MRWMTVQQMAKQEHVSDNTVYRWITVGRVLSHRVGRQWQVALRETLTAVALDPQGHQRFLVELIDDLGLEVERFGRPFPSVWEFPYRMGDPSSGLRLQEDGDGHRVSWTLATEKERGWDLALSHLTTGLPAGLTAHNTIKECWGNYWRGLSDAEDLYRAQASQRLGTDDGRRVTLDQSHFFRSILSDVDEGAAAPTQRDYETKPNRRGLLVRVKGMGIASVVDTESADTWAQLHLRWRRQFLRVLAPNLIRLRRNVQYSAIELTSIAWQVKARGTVPGTCELCARQ